MGWVVDQLGWPVKSESVASWAFFIPKKNK